MKSKCLAMPVRSPLNCASPDLSPSSLLLVSQLCGCLFFPHTKQARCLFRASVHAGPLPLDLYVAASSSWFRSQLKHHHPWSVPFTHQPYKAVPYSLYTINLFNVF